VGDSNNNNNNNNNYYYYYYGYCYYYRSDPSEAILSQTDWKKAKVVKTQPSASASSDGELDRLTGGEASLTYQTTVSYDTIRYDR